MSGYLQTLRQRTRLGGSHPPVDQSSLGYEIDEINERNPAVQGVPTGTRQELILQAFALASQVHDALEVEDFLRRRIFELSWAVCGLQDAGYPEGAWKPLQAEHRRLGREWGERQGIQHHCEVEDG